VGEESKKGEVRRNKIGAKKKKLRKKINEKAAGSAS